MRKLTILAAAAVAAVALMVAAPAQADEPFQVIDPVSWMPCDPVCEDIRYEGTFKLRSIGGGLMDTCYTRFDVGVEADGSLAAHYPDNPGYPPIVDCYYNFDACGNSWPGQIEVPGGGSPPQIDFTMCLIGNSQINHNLTFELYDNPRLWAQSGPDSFTGMGYITDAVFEDGVSGDDFVVELL